mmetsp:Transcript_10018/g.42106  ORF Transcript_10018/g.42106 Transcript_10018/m.42106 type:complete len:231 (+) Transcript_10018:3388-4080(+)
MTRSRVDRARCSSSTPPRAASSELADAGHEKRLSSFFSSSPLPSAAPPGAPAISRRLSFARESLSFAAPSPKTPSASAWLSPGARPVRSTARAAPPFTGAATANGKAHVTSRRSERAKKLVNASSRISTRAPFSAFEKASKSSSSSSTPSSSSSSSTSSSAPGSQTRRSVPSGARATTLPSGVGSASDRRKEKESNEKETASAGAAAAVSSVSFASSFKRLERSDPNMVS